MTRETKSQDGSVDRRRWLGAGLAAGLGVVLGAPLARARGVAHAGGPQSTGIHAVPTALSTDPAGARADAVIHIVLDGGLSHLDSFDPKPFAPVEVRGGFGTVRTSLTGERFSRLLNRTAPLADRLTVLRAMTHGEAAHERGKHSMLTGYRPSPAIIYPSFGSVFSHELGGRKALPPYVAIPSDREPSLGTGYLSAAHGPFSVGGEPVRSNFKVRDLAPRKEIDAERRERRRHLVDLVDEGFPVPEADGVQALEAFYEQAYALIENPKARAAFKISDEPRKTRDAYGRHTMGQRLLLARRLVAAGTRFVTVMQGGYDNHRDIRRGLDRNLKEFDQGFAFLIRDLERRGMLDRTLVLVTTEFGRTPRLNPDRGRDHWPRCFSCVAAGGGIARGLIHGRSDAEGAAPEEDAVTPSDLATTLFHLSGIDSTKRLMSPGNRPIDIARDGRLVKEILA